MKLLKKAFISLFFFIIFLFTFLLFIPATFAENKNLPSITVINMIRGKELGHESDDLAKSLQAQWQVTQDVDISATWLFQYSALEDEQITDFARNHMPSQEFGLLFEIDRNFASSSGVQFRGQGPWYFSDGLFLVSYDVSERQEMIDTAFTKFREVFGYYPKTVGAWWVGGDSIEYMQKKYGITGVLKASEQYDLDFYSLWGAPWGKPYNPSPQNEGIPAATFEESSRVAVFNWAVRDPVRGYKDPLYSIQDYPIKGYGNEYFRYLTSVYLRNELDNMVIGLENGGNLDVFNGLYRTSLENAKDLVNEKKIEIKLAKDYSRKFLDNKTLIPSPNFLLSKDYGSENQSFWYNSEKYRAFLRKEGDTISLLDLRDYTKRVKEDFAILPNSQSLLRTDTPSLIDSMRFPQNKVHIVNSKEPLEIEEKGSNVTLYAGETKIASFSKNSLKIFTREKNQIYNFEDSTENMSIPYYLLGGYFIYFVFIFTRRRNLKKSLRDILILFLPLIPALFFLREEETFLIDGKELVILNIFPAFYFKSINEALIFFKVFPFIILFVAHYIFISTNKKYIPRILFFVILTGITILYLHMPYFPLDATTYKQVVFLFGLTFVVLFLASMFIFRKTKSKKLLELSLIGIPIMLLALGIVIFFSRSKYAVTPFEQEALMIIKNQKKDVLLVYQIDYSIKPIYKAVKPALFENNRLGKNLTGKNWETVLRPEDNILKLENFDNKLIVVPRYLGADFSKHEMETLKVKKIFDNAQIAIYEKE